MGNTSNTSTVGRIKRMWESSKNMQTSSWWSLAIVVVPIVAFHYFIYSLPIWGLIIAAIVGTLLVEGIRHKCRQSKLLLPSRYGCMT